MAHVCAGMILPEPEWAWHRIAGFITQEYNKDHLTATPVNYVSSQYQHVPYPHYNQYRQSYNGGGGAYLEEIDKGQGNGGGLSA